MSDPEKMCHRPPAVVLQFQDAETTANPTDRVKISAAGCSVVATADLLLNEIVCTGYFRRVVGAVEDHGYAVAGKQGDTYEPAYRALRLPAAPVPILLHICNQNGEDDSAGVAMLQWLSPAGANVADPVEDAEGIAVCAVVMVSAVVAGTEITVCYGPNF
ncbi:hypothetical protein [Nereida ignava]|uniref:hypothetical protein n=1 Tax=Nereida ignava TaxID=282199 RepID=UPI0030F6A599